MISFEVLGEPKALKRHRMGKGFNYDPSKNDKSDFLWQVKKNAPPTPLDQPIHLKITFSFPRPKSHYGTGKNSTVLKATAPIYHTARPDIDNLIKFVCDALNTVYWKDDSCICLTEALKVYTDGTPKTEVEIITL